MFGEHDVDWWKYAAGIVSRAADTLGASWSALGDPNRWGSDGIARIPLALGAFATEQLIRVQTIDPYTRNWVIIGNIDATQQFWEQSSFNLTLGLEVSMGGGQATLVQTFDLRAITDADAPWYVLNPVVDLNTRVVKPFVINCAIAARSMNARVVCLGRNAVSWEDPLEVRVTALASCFAAGFPL